MGTTLNGTTPQNTYPSLIKVGDNGAVDATLQRLSDGEGNDLPLEVSSTAVNFTGTVTQNGNPISTPPSGVSGAIQFSDGSAFSSDAANLFWDDTNNRLGVGTNAPTSALHILGNTNTNIRSLQVQNLQNRGILSVANDGFVQVGDFSAQGYLAEMAFIRPAGASRATTFVQSNSNFTIKNVSGNVTFDLTPVIVKGSGTTSATTALLVQNSAGTELIKVADNGDLTTIDIFARAIYAKATNLELRGSASGSASSAMLQGFVSGLGWLSMFRAESGKDFGQIPRGAVVNGTTIDASAIFQVNSTTKGFLPPRMTTTEKNAISSPSSGLVVYDTTLNKLCVYTTAWETITSL